MPMAFVSAEGDADNLKCWEKDPCTGADGVWDNSSVKSRKDCPANEWGYCYPPAADIDLSVALSNEGGIVTQVKGLGNYIDTVYQFLLGFSTTVVIVFIIVGGFQYVLSAGSAQMASAAKKRISDALIGLVILMAASMILFTVNPQLIHLQMPAFPRIRQVVYISASTSCEFLLAQDPPFTVSDASGTCGDDRSDVTADPQGNPLEDTTCRWVTCGKTEKGFEKTCLEVDGADRCLACENFSAFAIGNGNVPSASDSLCASLTPDNTPTNLEDLRPYCEFTRDYDFGGDPIVAKKSGQCVLALVDCDKVDYCVDYGFQEAFNYNGKEDLHDLTGPSLLPNDDSIKENICTSNPCGLKHSCVWAGGDDPLGVEDDRCVSASANCLSKGSLVDFIFVNECDNCTSGDRDCIYYE